MRTHKRSVLILLSVLGVVFLANALPAAAQGLDVVPPTPNVTIANDVINLYKGQVATWGPVIDRFSNDLFWTLAGLSLAWFGLQAFLNYRNSLPVLVLSLAKKVLVIGMFGALLANYATWMPLILNMFSDIGIAASGIHAISPSEIVSVGINMAGQLWLAALNAGKWLDLPAAIAFLFGGAAVGAAFCILALQFVIVILEVTIAFPVGTLFVACGAHEATAPYAERYFAWCVSAGVKVMLFRLLVGLGAGLTNTWASQVGRVNIATFSVDILLHIVMGVVIYVGVCWLVPKIAAGILGGSPALTGSDGFGVISAFAALGAAGLAAASGIGAPAAAAGAGGAAGGAAVTGGAAASTSAGTGGGAFAATMAANAGTPTPQPMAPVGATASTGSATPQPAAPSPANGGGEGGNKVLNGAVRTINAANSAVSKMPHNGHGGSAPRFNGFDHS